MVGFVPSARRRRTEPGLVVVISRKFYLLMGGDITVTSEAG